MRTSLAALIPFCAALTLLGCASEPDGPPAPIEMPEVDLQALAVPNASVPLDGVLAAGQLSPEQMDELAAAGYESFISLRAADEKGSGWEETFAEENGIHFVRLEVAGKADVDEAHARALGELMDGEKKPMVVYCGSSNRVGALFGLKAYHVDGTSAEDSLALGLESGVTSLEPHFRDQLGL